MGDILVASWGYDQTNVDFYQVVKTTRTQVALRQLKTKRAHSSTGADYMIPVPNDFLRDDVIRRKWTPYNDMGRLAKGHPGYSVMINNYTFARTWDGKPKYQTAQGYGHN